MKNATLAMALLVLASSCGGSDSDSDSKNSDKPADNKASCVQPDCSGSAATSLAGSWKTTCSNGGLSVSLLVTFNASDSTGDDGSFTETATCSFADGTNLTASDNTGEWSVNGSVITIGSSNPYNQGDSEMQGSDTCSAKIPATQAQGVVTFNGSCITVAGVRYGKIQ